jgi:DNA-binding transcriptional LysR family regulator
VRPPQPAVSQQIRVIENRFYRQLIERRPVGFQVSADVEQYAARLRRAIEEIQTASSNSQPRGSERTLTIAALATFAQRRLIP